MTHRENLLAVLDGKTPERTVLSLFDWNMERAITPGDLAARIASPDWSLLLDRGLLISHHCEILEAIEHGVENTTESKLEHGENICIMRKKTPVGELCKVTRNGWHAEDWIKEPEDYLVWKWIVENTEILPRYERYAEAEDVLGDHGVITVTGSGNWTHRTPAMKINVDIAGTQQFCMDVAMEVPELFELYEVLKKQFLQEQHMIAAGPGKYVKWLENLTISMLGPDRYEDLLMSVYREAVPILESAGKRVFVHYDGALRCIADQIAAAPFHGIDSLTEPIEGDMTYDECRAAWPDLTFWGNINVDLYAQSAQTLREAVIEKRHRAGKHAFAFEISEDLPANWKQSIPVVLDALEELD